MRIAFVISDQHLIPHGGIGQFLKGFLWQVTKDEHVVDIISDTAPSNKDFLKADSESFVFTQSPISYRGHREAFAFGDSLNFEKMINFRDSILKSFNRAVPDLMIVNSIEALPAVFALGIHNHIPVVVYTHSEYLAGFVDYKASTFTKEFLEFNEMMIKHKGFIIGTQTLNNANRIRDVFGGDLNVLALPMPIPEPGLLKETKEEQSGVLFVGRFEDRKNPEEYLRVIKETGLPARVMTNETGAKKFAKRFEELGITDYKMVVGETGPTKVDFIKRSKIYYNPSKLESFGFTMLEGLTQCTTVVLENYSWTDNFDGAKFFKVNKKTAVEHIKKLYEMPTYSSLKWAKEYNKSALEEWQAFFEEIVPLQMNHKNKLKESDFSVRSHLTKLGRSYSIEDIKTLFNNKAAYQIKDTLTDQYWSLTGEFDIEEEVSLF